VRQALSNVLARHAGEISPTDYQLVDDFVYHYAAAVYTEKEHREDPRNRVFMGAWSSHKRHKPEHDCRQHFHRSPASGKWNEGCLRNIKRRRNHLLELGVFVIRVRSMKGGMLKATKKHKARGNSHVIWLGAVVEAELQRIQHANRGTSPQPPLVLADVGDVEAPARSIPQFTPPTRPPAQLTKPVFAWPGRRQLHDKTCTCETCFAKRTQQLFGHDPPEQVQP